MFYADALVVGEDRANGHASHFWMVFLTLASVV